MVVRRTVQRGGARHTVAADARPFGAGLSLASRVQAASSYGSATTSSVKAVAKLVGIRSASVSAAVQSRPTARATAAAHPRATFVQQPPNSLAASGRPPSRDCNVWRPHRRTNGTRIGGSRLPCGRTLAYTHVLLLDVRAACRAAAYVAASCCRATGELWPSFHACHPPFGAELRLGLCELRARQPPACELEAQSHARRCAPGITALTTATPLYMAHRVRVDQTCGVGAGPHVLVRNVGMTASAVSAAGRPTEPDVAFVASVGAIEGSAGYQLPGTVRTARDGAVTVSTHGSWRRQARGDVVEMGGLTVRAARGTNIRAVTIGSLKTPHIAFRLRGRAGAAVGIVASKAPRWRTLAQVSSVVDAARADDERRYEAYGPLAEPAHFTGRDDVESIEPLDASWPASVADGASHG